MNNTKKSGFTLIELLVVVAIIGILASLVIASLNQARSRGVDAAIKGSMSSMRAQAEIIYDDTNSYGATDGLCSNATFTPIKNDVYTKAGLPITDTTHCRSSTTWWYVYVPMTTDPTETFCVDSTGFAGIVPTAAAINTTLNACDPV